MEEKKENLIKRITELETLITNNHSKLVVQEKEIENLKNQSIGCIKNYDIKLGEKFIIVNITTRDKKINFPFICKTDTIFAEVENAFYNRYPNYSENNENVVFRHHGLKLKKLKTMVENSFRGFPGFEITVERKNLDK